MGKSSRLSLLRCGRILGSRHHFFRITKRIMCPILFQKRPAKLSGDRVCAVAKSIRKAKIIPSWEDLPFSGKSRHENESADLWTPCAIWSIKIPSGKAPGIATAVRSSNGSRTPTNLGLSTMRLPKSSATENHCDIVHLVRCLQKMEGHERCFARDLHHCTQVDICRWSRYCCQLSRDGDDEEP